MPPQARTTRRKTASPTPARKPRRHSRNRTAQVERDLQRVLARTFGTKAAAVRSLARQLARRDEMGLDPLAQEILAKLVTLVQDNWSYVQAAATVLEVAQAVKSTIDWVQARLESGATRLEDPRAVAKLRRLAQEHLAAEEAEVARDRQLPHAVAEELGKQQRALDIRRQVLDRAIR
jgi:hypothetical protein